MANNVPPGFTNQGNTQTSIYGSGTQKNDWIKAGISSETQVGKGILRQSRFVIHAGSTHTTIDISPD